MNSTESQTVVGTAFADPGSSPQNRDSGPSEDLKESPPLHASPSTRDPLDDKIMDFFQAPFLQTITAFLTWHDIVRLKWLSKLFSNIFRDRGLEITGSAPVAMTDVDLAYVCCHTNIRICDEKDWDLFCQVNRSTKNWHLLTLSIEKPLSPIDCLSECVFPPSLQHLDLGKEFNQTFDPTYEFPKKLVSLKYGRGTVPVTLPKGLQRLSCGYFPNGGAYELPPLLTHLALLVDGPLPKLPESLRSLKLCHEYSGPLPAILPPNLEELVTGGLLDRPLPMTLPESLRRLGYGHFPDCELYRLPEELTHLTQLSNGPLPRLPENLHSLKLCLDYDGPLPARLPPTLKELETGRLFDGALQSELPRTLEYLQLSDRFCADLSEEELALMYNGMLTDILFIDIVDSDGASIETFVSASWGWEYKIE